MAVINRDKLDLTLDNSDYDYFQDNFINFWGWFEPLNYFRGVSIPISCSNLIRFHKNNRVINMLKLKTMIKEQNISKKEIQEFTNDQSDSLYNILTEEPIQWNPEKSILFFDNSEGDFFDELSEIYIKF